MKLYKHKETIFLVFLMLVFTAVFFISYAFYNTGRAVISIGMDARTVDWMIMTLSILAIARVVFLIKDLEVQIAG